MLRTLRARLIVSYLLILAVCLLLAGSTFVLLVRDLRTKLALETYSNTVVQLQNTAQYAYVYYPSLQFNRLLEQAGEKGVLPTREEIQQAWSSRASPEELLQSLQQNPESPRTTSGVHILLVDDQGTIVADSLNTLAGQSIGLPPIDPGKKVNSWTSGQTDAQKGLVFVRPGQPPLPATIRREGQATGGSGRPPNPGPNANPRNPSATGPYGASDSFVGPLPYTVVMAVPEAGLGATWQDLLPGMAAAGAVALLLSLALAWLLSRSIARPLNQMTVAAEAMARGDYEHRIPVRRPEEVGRLAAAFNRMAREVGQTNRMLKDFLANASHELKTPLTSIQGFSQAMADGTLQTPEEYAEAGEIVHDEAARMRRLVDDLLYLSRIEAGQIRFDFRDCDLTDLLGQCAQRVQRQVQERAIHLTTELSPTLLIQADPDRLEQVFQNLLSNALKHTPAQGAITVRARPGGAPLGQRQPGVLVTVHNTGSHIPAEDLPRVFERFYQVDKSRAASDDGTGLGLTIARELVEGHGGLIGVRSGPEGTAFEVWLPLQAARPEQPAEARPKRPEPTRARRLVGPDPTSP